MQLFFFFSFDTIRCQVGRQRVFEIKYYVHELSREPPRRGRIYYNNDRNVAISWSVVGGAGRWRRRVFDLKTTRENHDGGTTRPSRWLWPPAWCPTTAPPDVGETANDGDDVAAESSGGHEPPRPPLLLPLLLLLLLLLLPHVLLLFPWPPPLSPPTTMTLPVVGTATLPVAGTTAAAGLSATATVVLVMWHCCAGEPGCWLSRCLRRSTFLWKALSHSPHGNGLYPECLRKCVIRLDDWLNALQHTTHLCGFSPGTK